jgi:hypothetical protein
VAPPEPEVERRRLRCGPGEEPDPAAVDALVVQGFSLAYVAPVGWSGGGAGHDFWYTRIARVPAPIRRRK